MGDFTIGVVPIVSRRLRTDEIVGHWNRTCVKDMGAQAVKPTTQNQCEGNVEPTRNHTKTFLGFPFAKTSGTHTWNEIQYTEICHYTYIFQAACGRHGISNGQAGPDRNTHLSLSSKTPKIKIHGYEIVATNVKKGDHTTRLSPSSFRPVSFRNATIKGHTPTILATTSTSSGIARLLVKIAFFSAGREAIQSRLSAPFNLFTMNSVMEYGSRVPKTLDAVFWRQRLKRRKSNSGYSINFCWYPLTKKFTYASTRAWGPLCTDITRTSGPIASMIRPSATTSSLTFPLNRSSTATHTRRNWLLSQQRRNTQVCSPCSTNSTPQ